MPKSEGKRDIPKTVERYVKEHLEQGNDESAAWALAWSRYCEYKNPGSPRCKQDSYFDGRKKKASARNVVSKYLFKRSSFDWVKQASRHGLFCEREKNPSMGKEEYIFWSDPSIKNSRMIDGLMGDLSVELLVMPEGEPYAYQMFTGNKSETFKAGEEKAIMREIVRFFNKFAI